MGLKGASRMETLELDTPELQVHRLVVGALETNCYILLAGGFGAVVDPGGDVERIVGFLKPHAPPAAILLTHAHADHIAAVGRLKECFPKALLHLHAAEADWPMHSAMSLSYWLAAPMSPCPQPDVLVHEGAELALGSLRIRVLHLPGHTPGSVGYRLAAQNLLFSGDVLFAGGIGRTDLPGSDAAAMAASLRRLAGKQPDPLPDDTLVLPGHGPATTIGAEKQANPFLAAGNPL